MSISTEYSAIRRSAAAYERAGTLVAVTGAGRDAVVTHVLARSTEFAQPGSVVDSLVLDDDGAVIDSVVAIMDESRTLIHSDAAAGLGDEVRAVSRTVDVRDVTVDTLAEWAAVGVEGPRSWEVVRDLLDDDIASLLLNEWRPIHLPGASASLLARTGTTAEYGYLVVADVPAEQILDRIRAALEAVDGAVVGSQALLRARLEVNHPVVPEQFLGLTPLEAGAGWAAGVGRQDAFRGARPAVVPHRRLVAVRSERPLEAGQVVEAAGRPVGRVHLCAPEIDGVTSYALALIDTPFDVPGLDLSIGGRPAKTVSRPAVQPASWIESIG